MSQTICPTKPQSFTVWSIPEKNLLTPNLTIVIILGQKFFEDFILLWRRDMKSSHKSVSKSKVNFSFFLECFKFDPVSRAVTWFSSCLKQKNTTLKKYLMLGNGIFTIYFLSPFFFISSSSTNAYMLIYRLKDSARNASMLNSYLVLICVVN